MKTNRYKTLFAPNLIALISLIFLSSINLGYGCVPDKSVTLSANSIKEYNRLFEKHRSKFDFPLTNIHKVKYMIMSGTAQIMFEPYEAEPDLYNYITITCSNDLNIDNWLATCGRYRKHKAIKLKDVKKYVTIYGDINAELAINVANYIRDHGVRHDDYDFRSTNFYVKDYYKISRITNIYDSYFVDIETPGSCSSRIIRFKKGPCTNGHCQFTVLKAEGKETL